MHLSNDSEEVCVFDQLVIKLSVTLPLQAIYATTSVMDLGV